MAKASKTSGSAPERQRSRVEYRLADDGGTLFRTFVDAQPGRKGERRWYAIEGHLRKMTPELESEIAELLAQALVADYRRRESVGTLDQTPPVETPIPDAHTSYVADLTERLWAYRGARFAGKDGLFDPSYAALPKPPVFGKDHADWNVIATKNDPTKASAVRALIPTNKRHRWFRSMKTPQRKDPRSAQLLQRHRWIALGRERGRRQRVPRLLAVRVAHDQVRGQTRRGSTAGVRRLPQGLCEEENDAAQEVLRRDLEFLAWRDKLIE